MVSVHQTAPRSRRPCIRTSKVTRTHDLSFERYSDGQAPRLLLSIKDITLRNLPWKDCTTIDISGTDSR